MRDKLLMVRHLILPMTLILAVLGSVYLGVATITEAAGIGAIGAVVIAGILILMQLFLIQIKVIRDNPIGHGLDPLVYGVRDFQSFTPLTCIFLSCGNWATSY